MSTLHLRQKLVDIARKDVGQTEVSQNQSPCIRKYWEATSTYNGYSDRWPYCAAAVCWWVREWFKDPEVLDAMKMSAANLEKWRCKSPAAFGWRDWAKFKGLLVMNDSQSNVLHTGDLMIFDMSHIGIVTDDKGSKVYTIEANTGPSGGRDGDGIWEKVRERSLAQCFVRIMP